MKKIKLEKTIKKLDKEIEALKIATKYLSNKDEIEEVRTRLNNERQLVADEIYSEDKKCYYEVKEYMMDMIDSDIFKEQQMELLDKIKEVYGRLSPNVSKDSNGLNAWLKFMEVEYSWTENPDSEWAILKITDFNLI